MTIFVPGLGERVLDQGAFVAKGGEGSVYAWDDVAIKVYTDPSRVIPDGKLRALSRITHRAIIKPEGLVRDRANRPVGYVMRYISDAEPLCRMFTRSYKERHGITPTQVFGWAREIQDGVADLHAREILVVDLNEMNFLVAPDANRVYFIDVDSYQVPRYPATALMDAIRDRHAPPGQFSEDTDWFSFAVVTFQLMVGIHPYRGHHPTVTSMDARMQQHLSVFNPEVKIPHACYPVSVIPEPYRAWYRDVLERGHRGPPPTTGRVVMLPFTQDQRALSGGPLRLDEVQKTPDPILVHAERDGKRVLVTATNVIIDGRVYPRDDDAPVAAVGFTPGEARPILVTGRPGSFRLYDVMRQRALTCPAALEAVMGCDGRLIALSGGRVLEIALYDRAETTLVTTRIVTQCARRASTLYDGVLIQDLLGRKHASIFAAPGCAFQVALPELDEARVVDAIHDAGVMVVIASRGGHYHRYRYRFDADYRRYDLSVRSDIGSCDASLVTLDTGVCVSFGVGDEIEVFTRTREAQAERHVDAESLPPGGRLVREAGSVLLVVDDRLMKLSLSA